jgi:UDP-GlcNAc3NAcA epimerase
VENLKTEGFTNIVANPSPLIPNPYSLPLVTNVGDTMLDAAFYYKQYAKKPQFAVPEQFILATIHRAENTDNAERPKSIFRAFDKICQEIPIILPLHPRTRKIIQDLKLKTSNFKLQIVEPVSYLEMVYLLERCILVMTDSGGLQKESTERIYSYYKEMMKKQIDFNLNLYGEGEAGRKIVNILV